MSEPLLATYTGAAIAAPALLIPSIPLPNGTITKVRVVLPDGVTDGAAVFAFYIDDVDQSLSLTILDTDDEIDASGLSIAITEDNKGSFRIIAPFPTELPVSPINFYIYYTPTGADFSPASATEVLTGTASNVAVTPDALAALWEQGSDITSAATISVGEGGYFSVTGSTGPITDIDFATTKAGRIAWLKFASTPTLTHHATTLILPTGANIVVAAGDVAGFVSEGGDNVRCFVYMRASGAAVAGGGGDALVANPLSQFAATTSLQLKGVLSDETGSGAAVFADTPTLVTPVLGTPGSGNLSSCTADGTNAVGFRVIPQNSQSAAYTTVLGDSGKHILHPAADTNARTFTIDSNANVAYPVGTAITFINETANVVTIAITSDTLTLAGTTTTGSRSLAQNGVATAVKVTTTKWIISGTGLT